jgi:hypothetical protein
MMFSKFLLIKMMIFALAAFTVPIIFIFIFFNFILMPFTNFTLKFTLSSSYHPLHLIFVRSPANIQLLTSLSYLQFM